MQRTLFAALILALPIAAFAQSTGQGAGTAQGTLPMREPNLANPQAQDNQNMQPPNAHRDLGSGQANSIPTPTLQGEPMTPIPQPAGPPSGPITR